MFSRTLHVICGKEQHKIGGKTNEAVVGYSGFVWYESQFETITTEQIEVGTDGDNANAKYNDVEGNQYNDSAVHNEGMEGGN